MQAVGAWGNRESDKDWKNLQIWIQIEVNNKEEQHNWHIYSTQTYWRLLCMKHHAGAGPAKSIKTWAFLSKDVCIRKQSKTKQEKTIRQLQDTGQ